MKGTTETPRFGTIDTPGFGDIPTNVFGDIPGSVFGDINSPGYGVIDGVPLLVEVPSPGHQADLLSITFDGAFQRYSPDQFAIIQWVRTVNENDPWWVQVGAGLIASFALGQGISDTVNGIAGRPRKWIMGGDNLPPREGLLKIFGDVQTPSLLHPARG